MHRSGSAVRAVLPLSPLPPDPEADDDDSVILCFFDSERCFFVSCFGSWIRQGAQERTTLQ